MLKTLPTLKEAIQPTIYNISTGKSKAAIAIIRISGSSALTVLRKLTKHNDKPIDFGRLVKRNIFDPKTNRLIDKAMVVGFKGPNTFTGEDLAELHIHGSKATLNSTLEALHNLNSDYGTTKFKLSEPGEFTRRAFYNNKLDLTEIEGLSALLNAETSQQLNLALKLVNGDLRNLYQTYRSNLILSLSELEAYIDFGEDYLDDELEVLAKCRTRIQTMSDQIKDQLESNRDRQVILSEDGIKIVIFGPPNVGKSTLLNKVTKQDSAIVSNIAGTTRDLVKVKIDLSGYLVTLTDSAGIRKTEDIVESIGVERALNSATNGDLLLFVLDAPTLLHNFNHNAPISDSQLLEVVNDPNRNLNTVSLVVNKIDLLQPGQLTQLKLLLNQHPILSKLQPIFLSLKNENHLQLLLQNLKQQLDTKFGNFDQESQYLILTRHRQHLQSCHEQLNQFLEYSKFGTSTVLAAEHLRLATEDLAKITGIITNEHILDSMFQNFCIGK